VAVSDRRPLVTVAYAQSLDGCIAARPGTRTPLSGPESLAYTHRLRAAHDAVLVGIGTVLADDPRLTVRLASGNHPQPIVLDSRLRLPLSAALLRHPTHRPWLATTHAAAGDAALVEPLQALGAELFPLASDAAGRIDLSALLAALGGRGIRTLMVEGGAGVLTAFLAGGHADRISVTVAPRWLGGLPALTRPLALQLHDPVWRDLGDDRVLEARLSDREAA